MCMREVLAACRAVAVLAAAYLRRDRDRVVLVVANVGTTSAVNVTLTTPDAALRPGT
jgi:hypothetical protein